MRKVTLILANANLDYLKLLTEYIRNTEFSEKFIVKCFSQTTALEQYIKEERGLDILLVQRDMLPSEEYLSHINTLLLFKDTITGRDSGYTFIDSFQPLNQMFNQVLNCFNEKNGFVAGMGGTQGKTTVVSLFSTTGNCGKTTVSINLCHQVAALGYKVFYLNLELLSSQPLFFENSGDGAFSQILYYLKKGNEQQVALKIQSLKHYSMDKIEYINPAENMVEMSEMNSQDVSLLIDALVNLGTYDYIFIDTESCLDGRILTALQKSDCILWLILDDVQYLHKTYVLLNHINNVLKEHVPEERIRFVINKFTGTFANSARLPKQQPVARLPYIPEWKSVTDCEKMFKVSIFNEHIMKLFYDLFEDRR